MHIAIAGNIGAGKTTLTGLLAKHYNWDTHFEDVDDNPYLMDFYDEMQRWSEKRVNGSINVITNMKMILIIN